MMHSHHMNYLLSNFQISVLILVVMDDALALFLNGTMETYSLGLNPCCNG